MDDLDKIYRRIAYNAERQDMQPKQIKLYQRPNPSETGPRLLPVKRAEKKRPEGMSARQWKRAQKAARREENN